MKRRDSIKSLLVGGIAGASIATTGCKIDPTENTTAELSTAQLYGRTPSELAIDEKLAAEVFLNDHELATIATLCDIILPATATAGSATDAGVPAFIDFIVKDISAHQLPMRGGLMWLDGEANKRYNKLFIDCSDKEQLIIIDDIAYPDKDNKHPELAAGRTFFNRMRNLTLTGYYTSKIGLDDLGYKGNRPNTWDGVPQEVLDKHGLAYPKEWLPKFIDHEKRNVQAEWDDQGNLLT